MLHKRYTVYIYIERERERETEREKERERERERDRERERERERDRQREEARYRIQYHGLYLLRCLLYYAIHMSCTIPWIILDNICYIWACI